MNKASSGRTQNGVLQQVQDTIDTHDLVAPDARVVVGLSGGPDSMCLLHVLKQLRDSYDLQIHVAHLNHSTRGRASDADAEYVRMIADQWDLPVTTGKRDVPKLAQEHGLAFEEAARRVRYAFLGCVASEVGAATIAVGHQADDQAETVLMHVIRGAGLTGLRGMLPRTRLTDYRLLSPFMEHTQEGTGVETRDRQDADASLDTLYLIRPLLEVPRADIERYCAEHDLRPRFDRSNLDTTHFRNRLRHELLPQLETYNPRIRERLCHMATVAAADYDLLVELRDQAWGRIVEEERKDAIVFDKEAWQALPVSLQRATLRLATRRLRHSLRDVTFVHVENARRIALDGGTGKISTLPMGLALSVGYDTLRVSEAGKKGPPPDEPLLWSDAPLPVSVPGTTPLPETDWVLQADSLERWTTAEITEPDHRWMGYFDTDALEEPVVLRTRRCGDRFRPLGMGGHQVKISELMTNLKIPEPWRDHVPLLVANEDILWVCGRRVAESGKVGPDTTGVVRFQFQHLA